MAKTINVGNVPNLRFPGFADVWKKFTLEEIGEFKNGINKGGLDFGFGVPFVNLMDVFGKPTISSNDNFGLVNANEKETELYELKKGDVLFIRSSVKKSGVGETALLTIDLPQTVYSGFLIRFRDIKMRLNLNFKIYCFSTNKFRNNLISLSSTSANTNINQGSLNSLSLFVPPSSEQVKISTFLLKIDERISTQSKIIEELKLLKSSVGKKIFTQKLQFETKATLSSWEVRKLEDVCVIIGGGTPETNKSTYWNGDIQWFTPTEIKKDFVTKSQRTITQLGLKNSSAKILPVGTILLTTRATIGAVAIALEPCTTNQGFQSLVVKDGFDNLFLFNWLKQNQFELTKRANGSTFPEISKSEIEKISISIPDLPEQTKIGNFLSKIDEKIDIEGKLLKELELQKNYLLSNLFI